MFSRVEGKPKMNVPTYIIEIESGYYYSTPNGRYGRFGARKQAMRMCKGCTVANVKWLKEIGENPHVEKAGREFQIMPTCKKHLNK